MRYILKNQLISNTVSGFHSNIFTEKSMGAKVVILIAKHVNDKRHHRYQNERYNHRDKK